MEVNTEGWSSDNHIVLAVSTGIDSMVLLHQLITNLQDTYAQLTCLHVNHNIRPIANEEELFLKQYCIDHNIALHVKQLDLSDIVKKGNSIENEARLERYRWFDLMMKNLNADVLLTAHHQDDQLETIFYRLMTGRSTRSSLGMSYLTTRGCYDLCKPLLTATKVEIRNYQHAYDVPFYEDATNAENHYVRNDIRNRILPEIEQNKHLETKQLLKLKEWHDEQRLVIESEATAFIESAVEVNNAQYRFCRQQFLQLRHSVKMTVLDKLLANLPMHDSLTEKTYNQWFQIMEENIAQSTLYTTDKWIIYIAYDKFIIMANDDVKLSPAKMNQSGTYNYSHYSIDINNDLPAFEFPLVVRTRNDGDKFELNGMKGHKKVSRLLIDNKIEQQERDQMPIIVNADNEIIAVGTLFLKSKYKDLICIRNMGEE
ncbi:tRNA lysidine(34) synthetase TilS [Staphylococcus sp. mip270_02]|uniref:tRNA(Ile)-lysidine synthase n=1 Tax=Staphylococcus xylosus TaxID=1288 RepID=A0A418IPB1_STAXY|nr:MULTISPECIES: tRNA lysidine(34) synthetase TilS [Staphylococcus]MBF0814712.1 tRNA lysidine(34) synthetase TilS [Staphylococcus saprophyticus]MDW8543784.1 tRNA lysidine(34) synthetase TilS [Staphylococcus sp. KG4-1]MRF36405.1 tRNA lysidine(34) synthetase TilS [Staphylococcus sp. KY49P]MDW8561477.1 tRNA lysidine(34) synthetase TilS [Staphylococcus sp. KG4-3]PTI08226.1 tRNA lysidine(34) synthetase TilS [Staphylococcus xylosus]